MAMGQRGPRPSLPYGRGPEETSRRRCPPRGLDKDKPFGAVAMVPELLFSGVLGISCVLTLYVRLFGWRRSISLNVEETELAMGEGCTLTAVLSPVCWSACQATSFLSSRGWPELVVGMVSFR